MSSKGYIKFWGVRGSFPTPDLEKLNYGGDTSCVEVRTYDNQLFIFDMGTGLRKLGEKIISDTSYPKDINIFLSHYHWDHIMGFFTFAPLYVEGYNINIYGYNKHTPINQLSDTLINTNFWPADHNMYKASIKFNELPFDVNIQNTISIENTKIIYSIHGHPNGTNSYRLESNNKSVVYITDCEHPHGSLNPNVLEISENADILIHDSHFTINDLDKYKGWGHSSWKQAVDVAIKSHIKQLILFHFCPDYNDSQVSENEKNAQSKFVNTLAAKQGLKLEF